jgi:hypothetical protein
VKSAKSLVANIAASDSTAKAAERDHTLLGATVHGPLAAENDECYLIGLIPTPHESELPLRQLAGLIPSPIAFALK